MAKNVILAGLGMVTLSLSGRLAIRSVPRTISNIENLIKSIQMQQWSAAWANAKYYKGGFQPKMTKREVKGLSSKSYGKDI